MVNRSYIKYMRPKTSKAELIATSLDYIWSNGYSNTSIKEIVQRAGILKGSFYNYFESKDQFVSAVLESYVDEWARSVAASLLDKSQSPKVRLQNLFQNYRKMYQGDMLTKGCMAGNICQEMGGVHQELSCQVEAAFLRIEAMYETCLIDAVKAKQIDTNTDTAGMAAFLHNGLQGAFMRMKSAKSNEPLDSFERSVFGLLFND